MKYAVIDCDNGKNLEHFKDSLSIVHKCTKKLIVDREGEECWNNMPQAEKRRLLDKLFRYSVCDDGVMVVGVNRGNDE